MFTKNRYGLAAIVAAVSAAMFLLPKASAQGSADAENAAAREGAWTLQQARDHLAFFPHDAYVQYVALQLARQQGRLDEVSHEIWQQMPRRNRWSDRREQVNLFTLFSGQLAVQESLQLDAMAPQPIEPGPQDRQRQGPLPLDGNQARRGATVRVADLTGPEIQSHPWRQMLGDRQPSVTGLALSVPEDFFFVSFRSAGKLLDAMQLANDWGGYAFTQASQSARTQLATQRLLDQLAIQVNPEFRDIYDAAVTETAIVGSDLFFREGSDVTLLFGIRQPQAFRLVMDRMLYDAQQARVDAVRSTGEYLGVEYTSIVTPDRQVHVFSANPTQQMHVRSNSLAGLKRVLAAVKGADEQGRPVTRLGETDEFRYVRSLMPEGADEEDGFVYLSDPFVRRLMSPQVRLTERRRLLCYNHLRMIGHGALMHRTQTGDEAKSLRELAESGCAPGEFGAGAFVCPDGGDYTLAGDGLTGVCSHHGYASYLTPCLEAKAERVTEAEAQAYRQFVAEYSQYWRQFFDPIAIRVRLTPDELRAETLVLPLIDNTIYTALSNMLGGEPQPLDALPVPDSNIFSVAVRVDKEALLYELGMDELLKVDDDQRAEWAAERHANARINAMRNILLSMLNYESVHRGYPAADNKGLSWRVHVLPFLEEQALYDQFHLDEPWDSPHNRELVAKIPAIFRPSDAQLAAAGRTRFVMSRGPGALFEEADQRVQLRHIIDGTSNTVAVLEVDDDHAVVWTKPDDFELDPNDARNDLAQASGNAFLMGFGDGSVRLVSADTSPETLAALVTRAGGDPIDDRALGRVDDRGRRRRRLSAEDAELLDRLQLGRLLVHGVGDQVALHACDATPTIDLSLARLLGMALGSGRRSGMVDDGILVAVPLISAINGPVYASVPVKDPAVVDDFLQRLAGFLAEVAAQDVNDPWFPVDFDFYQSESPLIDAPVWTYSLGAGPVKWRFFWTRIGNGVYIASQREVLEQIAEAARSGRPAAKNDAGNQPAHALLRMRPEHWRHVLSTYQLGWEENQRCACHGNLGPLAALQRANSSNASSPVADRNLEKLAARIYDATFFCPDRGAYHAADGGRNVACTVHGTVQQPRQSLSPAANSDLSRQIARFRDLNIRFTFLEDGLRAVVTLQLNPAREAPNATKGNGVE